MFKRILVPLDGSQLAERALRPARLLAERAGAELLLVRVLVPRELMIPVQTGYDVTWSEIVFEQAQQDALDYLEHIKDTELAGLAKTRYLVGGGDEAGAIVDLAVEERADLIVMSTHGRSGISRWLLGSITEKVLRGARCPVLVIRYDQPLRNLLLTLDGSALSEAALEPGLAIASLLAGRLTLLRVDDTAGHVVHTPLPLPDDYEPGAVFPPDHICEGEACDYLKAIVAERQAELDEPIRTVVLAGRPASRILEFADIDSSDLIVMATHGRSGLSRWVYGSVTEKVLRGADCALLVVAKPDR